MREVGSCFLSLRFDERGWMSEVGCQEVSAACVGIGLCGSVASGWCLMHHDMVSKHIVSLASNLQKLSQSLFVCMCGWTQQVHNCQSRDYHFAMSCFGVAVVQLFHPNSVVCGVIHGCAR